MRRGSLVRSRLLVAVVLVGALACAGCTSNSAQASLGLEKLEATASSTKIAAVSPADQAVLTVAVAKSEAAPVKVARRTSSKSASGSGSSKTPVAEDPLAKFRRVPMNTVNFPPVTIGVVPPGD